jgi:phospholipase C
MTEPASPPRFDHVVVVMFENRSFDNVLGRLYQPGEVPEFDGLTGRALSNPIPATARDADRRSVPTHVAENLDTPNPDPGEEHPHTNVQMFGRFLPETNRSKGAAKMEAPYNRRPDPSAEPTMDGFVADYISAYRDDRGREPRFEEYAQAMAGYSPAQLPVLSTLAREFACFDRWFCEVPSQTFPNRSFFHAGTSSGFVVNLPAAKFPTKNTAETIFERLEAAGLPWKVYFDPIQLVSITGIIHAQRLAGRFGSHFVSHEEFYKDVREGTLPAYAFVEPCLIPPHSDMHPPGYPLLIRAFSFLPRASPMRGGEAFLAQVYEAVRTSASTTGSNWKNTLLLVTFDEHGGTYDHVAPPRVPPPDPNAPIGEMGFRFDRSGLRIPTIAISAWVDPRTVVHEEYRSTSLIRTLRERWALGPPLTQRDAVAADIGPVLRRTTPRPPSEWPRVESRPHSRAERFWGTLSGPLPGLGAHLMAAALAYEESRTGTSAGLDVGKVSRRRALRRVRALKHATFARATKGPPRRGPLR